MREDITFIVLIIVIVLLAIFLIIRDLITWYFKINKRVELLEEIEEHLNILTEHIRKQNESEPTEQGKESK